MRSVEVDVFERVEYIGTGRKVFSWGSLGHLRMSSDEKDLCTLWKDEIELALAEPICPLRHGGSEKHSIFRLFCKNVFSQYLLSISVCFRS